MNMILLGWKIINDMYKQKDQRTDLSTPKYYLNILQFVPTIYVGISHILPGRMLEQFDSVGHRGTV